MPSTTNDTFSPEMIRILKIFGLGSILLVLILSFFNDRKANNSGDESNLMRITDADRLYFKNIRAPYYDLEGRDDAKINIYRYGKRIKKSENPIINLSILLNRIKNEAYIFVEPAPETLPFVLKWKNETHLDSGKLAFYGGDKIAHFDFVMKLNMLMQDEIRFELEQEENTLPILKTEKEREALAITMKDYFRMVNFKD
jgi:hypothetical protein